jgi:hypothetical protein
MRRGAPRFFYDNEPAPEETATDAIFAWQNEVLKFADMRLCANMKLLSDVAEVKDASEFARIQAEHLLSLYEHVSNAAVGYSRRVQNILSGDSQDNPTTPAEQSAGSKRQSDA